MPVATTYPGVYIEEVPSGVRTITGVATSITAFVGYTARGLDHRATRILSFADYERELGGLVHDSELSYAVQQFFANGGSQAYVVRVPRAGSVAASITLWGRSATAGPPQKVLVVTALSKGAWGNNAFVDVDHNVPTDDPLAFNLTVTDPATGTVEAFANVTLNAGKSNYVANRVNDEDNGSRLISVTVPSDATSRPVETGTVGEPINLSAINSTKASTLKLSSDRPDIASLTVVFLEQGEPVPTSLLGVCRLLESKVNVALQTVLPGARVSCVPSSELGVRVIAAFPPEKIPGGLDAIITFSAGDVDENTIDADIVLGLSSTDERPANVAHYWLGQGATEPFQSDAVLGTEGVSLPLTADLIGSASAFTGIYALEKVDLFNLLCIPDATRAIASDPKALSSDLEPNSVFEAALAYCQTRRAFLLVDPLPSVDDVDAAIDWATSGLTARGKNAAAYFPRLKLRDPLNDFQMRVFAPCGVVAGLFARTDAARGVWKAPAGTETQLAGVQGTVYSLTDSENGLLNPLGLNCFRTFPIYGTVAWGARTLDGADAQASEWKYVPVRRLALFLEESLYRGTQWVVFEPNDEPLWSQIRLNLGAFMQNLFRQGAFQGKTPAEAYFVKCDHETTTQNDINLGIVNIVVGFAPLKPAEFVVIKIQQIAGAITA